jgi:gamma-glutamyltranspeptidase/glutathione hydrolase
VKQPAAVALLIAVGRAALAAPEPVAAPRGMVVSVNPIASRVGADVLARGGNAVDAAVAVALALAVTWPCAGNLGGGGFLLVRRADGRAELIDYRETAPARAAREMYLDAHGQLQRGASTVGPRAVAVPGTVAGLALALERHGTRPWAELVEPARKLAAEGYPLTRQHLTMLRRAHASLERFPESRRIFLRDGKPWRAGDRFVQPELAETLARLGKEGPREFYQGETARRIVAEMAASGGLISAEDLAGYRAKVRPPVEGDYRGYHLISAPPPSSGGAILIEMLHMLERFPVAQLGFHSVAHLHLLAEVMRRAFADRNALLADTDFVRVPLKGLLDPRFAAERAAAIDPARATPSSEIKAGDAARWEAPETTHFTIVDGQGNVVANTFTLNGLFGSGVTARRTGVLLNDEMDDFSVQPGAPNALFKLVQGEQNAIAPGKRPLSAMCPTIVLRDGKVVLAVGAPGGPTIINTVLQVISNVIDFGMNLKEAVDAPRIHHQWLPDAIVVERLALDPDTRAALERRGHHLAEPPAAINNGYFGDAEAIGVGPDGERLGASDHRLNGEAVGE